VKPAGGLTALVLAGTRPGGDPLAASAGVTHKALIEVGGVPMLARVLAALAAAPAVARMVVIIDRPEVMALLPAFSKPVTLLAAQSGPSASVAAALAQVGAPVLVTTADNALLRPEWIAEFLAADRGTADAVLALARREAVLAAAPGSQRTWLRFSDGDYSGCNLFLLRNDAAMGVLRLWQQMEEGHPTYAPAFYDVLLNYPQAKPAGLEERFFCIRYALSGRPNITLRHRLAMPVDGGAYVAADREFYVSHDYNETQAIAALLPVEDGTVVTYVNRTTTDQLGGFGASTKQSIGRSMMAKQISEIFEKSRAGFAGK